MPLLYRKRFFCRKMKSFCLRMMFFFSAAPSLYLDILALFLEELLDLLSRIDEVGQ